MREIPNPLRIVCTKCVRVAKVISQEYEPWNGDMLIAVACCERTLGVLPASFIQRGDLSAATVANIQTLDLAEFERSRLERIEKAEEMKIKARKQLDLIRWAKGEIDAPE